MTNPFKLLLPCLLSLLVLLTGCVRYDVGINFEHQHRGSIVQHITLGEQLTNFSQEEVKKWLNSVEKRTKELNGTTKRVTPQEVVVTIPFNNGGELVKKFNQFFNPNLGNLKGKQAETLDLVKLTSKMSLDQSNMILVERDRMKLQVDLRGLGVLSEQGNLIVSPGTLLNIEFGLNTPWGGRSIVKHPGISPQMRTEGTQLIWQLQPGQINELEVVFWLPSPVGIGTLIIILLILAAFYLKYKRFPGYNATIAEV